MLKAIIIILSIINVISCVLMVLIVLMQRSKNDGLGASFGGGITDSMFGAQTSSVLVKATSVLAISFLLSATLLASSLAYKNKQTSAIQEQLQATEAVVPATTTPTTAPVVTEPISPVTTPTLPTTPTPAPAKK